MAYKVSGGRIAFRGPAASPAKSSAEDVERTGLIVAIAGHPVHNSPRGRNAGKRWGR